jgi:hypothetical protein
MMAILSMTKVTKEVVTLALLYAYRLKNFNPSIIGKAGSEYRLMSVALMLANKCKNMGKAYCRSLADMLQFWMIISIQTGRGPNSAVSRREK